MPVYREIGQGRQRGPKIHDARKHEGAPKNDAYGRCEQVSQERRFAPFRALFYAFRVKLLNGRHGRIVAPPRARLAAARRALRLEHGVMACLRELRGLCELSRLLRQNGLRGLNAQRGPRVLRELSVLRGLNGLRERNCLHGLPE
jgi:hypothetical protein